MGAGRRQHHRKTHCAGWSIKGEGCEICCRHSVGQHLLQTLGLRFVLLWLSHEETQTDSLKVGRILSSSCFGNGIGDVGNQHPRKLCFFWQWLGPPSVITFAYPFCD